jgi:hypothetical protein
MDELKEHTEHLKAAGAPCLNELVPSPTKWDEVNRGSLGVPNYFEIKGTSDRGQVLGSTLTVDLTRGVELGFQHPGENFSYLNNFQKLSPDKEAEKLLGLGAEALRVTHNFNDGNWDDVGPPEPFLLQANAIMNEVDFVADKGQIRDVVAELEKHPDVVRVDKTDWKGDKMPPLVFHNSDGLNMLVLADHAWGGPWKQLRQVPQF